MRTLSRAVGALALAASLVALGPVMVAQADEYPVPATLTVIGDNGQAVTVVAVPQGSQPASLRGQFSSSFRTPGRIILTVGGRTAAEFPTTTPPGEVEVPLLATDSAAGSIELGMSVDLDDDGACFAEPDSVAELSGIVLDITVPTTRLTTPADFLRGAPRTVTVVLPESPTESEAAAGLTAVSVMARQFPRPTLVSISDAAPVTDRPDLDRTIRITQASEGSATVSVVGEELAITGQADDLTATVASLSSPFAELLGAQSATEPRASQEPASLLGGSVPMSELVPGQVSLSGVGAVERTVAITQSALGGPTSRLELDLIGTVTPPAGGVGRVSVLWNEELVSAVELADTDQYRAQVTIDSAKLRRDNGLTLRLDYRPASGRCTQQDLPARFDLDTSASRLSVTAGPSETGFAMFPQVFTDGLVPVASGSGAIDLSATRQAAQLLASLQRLTDTPLLPVLTDLEALAAGGSAGVAVKISEDTDEVLAAPLRYAPFRTVDVPEARFTAQVDGSYAAIQGYLGPAGQALLVLGSHGPEGRELADDLAERANDNPLGWFALTGDVLVLQPDQPPFSVGLSELSLQPEVVQELRSAPLWWLWAMLAGVVVIIGARWWYLRRLRRRAERDAAADARAEAEEHDPAGDTSAAKE